MNTETRTLHAINPKNEKRRHSLSTYLRMGKEGCHRTRFHIDTPYLLLVFRKREKTNFIYCHPVVPPDITMTSSPGGWSMNIKIRCFHIRHSFLSIWSVTIWTWPNVDSPNRIGPIRSPFGNEWNLAGHTQRGVAVHDSKKDSMIDGVEFHVGRGQVRAGFWVPCWPFKSR